MWSLQIELKQPTTATHVCVLVQQSCNNYYTLGKQLEGLQYVPTCNEFPGDKIEQ